MQDFTEGFDRLEAPGFDEYIGPIYQRISDDGVTMRLLVQEHHCSPLKIIHGGVLATLADRLLGSCILAKLDREKYARVLTINLNIDYLGSAQLGEWLEARGVVARLGSSIAFTEGTIHVGEQKIVRVNGVFKLVAKR